MTGSMFLSTNHTSFTVKSLDATIPFLVDLFGFKVTSRATRDPKVIEAIVGVAGAQVEIAYLRGADHTIELIEYTAPAGRGSYRLQPCDVGFAHIAFDVTSVADVVAAAAAYGVHPIAPPLVNTRGGPNQGAVVCYLRMADGVTVEVIQRPTGAK